MAITSSEYNRRVTRLEESLGQKESELALLGKEKDDSTAARHTPTTAPSAAAPPSHPALTWLGLF